MRFPFSVIFTIFLGLNCFAVELVCSSCVETIAAGIPTVVRIGFKNDSNAPKRCSGTLRSIHADTISSMGM